MRRVNYYNTLCGLLHDVGKVFLRYRQRYDEGMRHKKDLEKYIPDIHNVIPARGNHEKVGIEVVKIATGERIELPNCRLRRNVVCKAISYADAIAAAERGLGSYRHLSKIWPGIEKIVNSQMKLLYKHTHTPLLSPFWIAYVTNYANAVGPCTDEPYLADTALVFYQQLISTIAEGLETGDASKIASKLTQLLADLADKPLWIPPRPLTVDEILKLRTYSYIEAQELTSYSSIARWLFNGLKIISEVYKTKWTRGYVDTVGELLRFTLFGVPAAVYMALLPDTSLYSHSKLVAAYTAALSTGSDRFRILVVDARGIQNFVASPVVAKAASRVIRGRSFLVELLLTSLVNYILELYGGLPYTNVLTSEGGTVVILVPVLDVKNEETVLDAIRRIVRSTYERFRGLWFTVAVSREFSLEDVDFVKNLSECRYEEAFARCPGFFELEEDLAKRLAIEKARDEAQSVLSIDERDIEGFDAITKEPVSVKDLTEWYGFRVVDTLKDYASAISGGKLEVGDLVCEPTHLSLVAGSALRNLVYLVSIYVYKLENAIPVPAAEDVKEVLDVLRRGIEQTFEKRAEPKRLFFGGISQKDHPSGCIFNVAIIPLPTLGAFHIMISSHSIDYKSEEVSLNIVFRVLEMVETKLKELMNRRCHVRVEVRVVNKGVEFVEILKNKSITEVAIRLLDSGVDLYFGTLHTGTYHPATPEGLVDLDVYNLIAMAKTDADSLGEVRKLLSFSPTRLSALSDYITMLIYCKTNILASKVAIEYAYGNKLRGPIILYAGGDDVVLYGYWVDVLLLLSRFYRDVVNALFPLSYTSAVAIEKSDYPLLELYSKVVRQLDLGKEEAKGWVHIADISSTKPVTCMGGRVKLTAGLQPSEVGVYAIAPKPAKPPTPLELYELLTTLIEKFEKDPESKSRLADYKRELMLLSRIAALSEPELSELARTVVSTKAVQDVNALYSLTRRLVALSYISARRIENFEKLTELLSNLLGVDVNNARLHHKPGEDVLEALRRVLSSKTSIDVLLLYLNPYSTEIRTRSTS